MGCDLHGKIEVLTSHGWWEDCVDIHPYIERNYMFFGAFFGVRRPVLNPQFKGRRMPEDLDWTTKDWVNDSDHHSESYFTLEDIDKINWDRKLYQFIDWNEHEVIPLKYDDEDKHLTIRDVTPDYFWKIIDLMKYLKKEFEDVRCIICFDN